VGFVQLFLAVIHPKNFAAIFILGLTSRKTNPVQIKRALELKPRIILKMDVFRHLPEYVAIAVEAAATLIISYGAAEAIYGASRVLFRPGLTAGQRKEIWLHFAIWLLLGLEFELAADIIRTAIAPSWNDIGQLAAIGIIRTFLNYFLEADLDKYAESAPTRPTGNNVKGIQAA
jgi:uncharacterized membrane protein